MSRSMAFMFRRRYNLPPTDPRFLDATLDEMAADYWAHLYADDPKAADEEAIDDDFSVDDELARIDAEAAALDEVAGIDDWEPIK